MTNRELTETLRLLLDLWVKAEAVVEADPTTPDDECPDCDGAGQPLPDGADHEQYSRCGNCRGWFSY
tara:strand:+ start:3648 stop:3848 length:201 start_codon:yes stop_codon:yes gene_type:complete